MRRAALALLSLCAVIALPTAGCSAEPQNGAKAPAVDAAFGEKVRAYLMEHPEVIQEVMNRWQEVQAEKLTLAAATAIHDNRKALERDARDPVLGNPNGVVTVTEFFDYRCPYCKAATPALPAFLEKHKNVRFVFKELPILSEASEHAARMALAAKMQGKYQAVHTALMSAPVLDDQTIDQILMSRGVDVAKAHKDAQGPEIKAHLEDVKKLAMTLGVGGTPAFIVGDKVSNGWSPEELDEYITLAAKTGGRKPDGK
jgi:protein-disulfide isomerase